MGACSCCGSLFGLVLGSRGALRKDFFFFFGGLFFVVAGGVFLLWVPFWACFWGSGGSKKGFLFLFFLGGFFLFVLVRGSRFSGCSLGSRALLLGLVFFVFFFFGGGRFFFGGLFFLWVPFWACFWGHGGL